MSLLPINLSLIRSSVPSPTAPISTSDAALVQVAAPSSSTTPSSGMSGLTAQVKSFLMKPVYGNINVGEVGLGVLALGAATKLLKVW